MRRFTGVSLETNLQNYVTNISGQFTLIFCKLSDYIYYELSQIGLSNSYLRECQRERDYITLPMSITFSGSPGSSPEDEEDEYKVKNDIVKCLKGLRGGVDELFV